jgi:hypothetical protein
VWVMADLVCAIAAAIFGFVLVQLSRKTRQRRRKSAADRGGRFEVPAKLRLLQRQGYGGRWREGFVYRHDGKAMFRPRKPRGGPRLDLSGTKITGSRIAEPRESWWFAGHKVLLLDGRLGPFEVASGNDEYVELAGKVFEEIIPGVDA